MKELIFETLFRQIDFLPVIKEILDIKCSKCHKNTRSGNNETKYRYDRVMIFEMDITVFN